MGDRGSINIICKKTKDVSVTLFRHWQGNAASMIKLCEKTKKEFIANRINQPFNQVAEIIARATKIAVEQDGYSAYLGKDEKDGDNSDNGHFTLFVPENADTKEWVLKQGEIIIARLK